jgi:hypothetical protein
VVSRAFLSHLFLPRWPFTSRKLVVDEKKARKRKAEKHARLEGAGILVQQIGIEFTLQWRSMHGREGRLPLHPSASKPSKPRQRLSHVHLTTPPLLLLLLLRLPGLLYPIHSIPLATPMAVATVSPLHTDAPRPLHLSHSKPLLNARSWPAA